MKRLTVALLILALAQTSFTQPGIDFIRLYDNGDTPEDRFCDVDKAANGDYLVCGSQSHQPWLLRLDPDGAPRWDYTESGMVLYCVIEAGNGDIVTVGSIGDDSKFGAIRLTSEGEVIWRREYGAANRYRRAHAVIELNAGGFMLCGSIAGRGYINRIGENGDVIWEYSYGDGGYSPILFSMRETEGGVIAVGNGTSNQNPGNAMKVSFDGEVLWSRYVGRTNTTLVSTPEGFAIGATWYDEQTRASGPWLIKIDDGGNVTEDTLFSLPFNTGNWFDCLARIGNSGFILATEMTGGTNFPIAIRIDNQNNILWTEDWSDSVAVQDEGYNGLAGVIVEEGNKIVTCGWLNSRAHGGTGDAMLVRFREEQLDPILLSKSPEDSILTVLPDTPFEFAVHVQTPYDQQESYQWTYRDSVISRDSTLIIQFDSLGNFRFNCRISVATGEITVPWIIHVRDLFIADYSPDTLNLALRRGTTLTFAIDSVAAVADDWIQYYWTWTDLDNFQREDAGTEPRATVEFLQSGNFQIAGLAYQRDSRDDVVWWVQVRSAIRRFSPRGLRLSVLADSLINFRVWPFNPESDSLSYRWEVDGDSVGSDSTVELRFAWRGFGNPPYAVMAIVMDGAEGDTVNWTVTVREPDGVRKGESEKVEKWGMLSVSPNPFNNSTIIRFVVPSASASTSASSASSAVNLTLHDLTGREVQQLVDTRLGAGNYSLSLNGAELPPGIYLLRLESASHSLTRKLVVLK